MNWQTLVGILNTVSRSGLGAPLLLIILFAMVIVPLPPLMLDMFFTFNIALSLAVLLVSIYITRPLEFSVYPTVLLVTTLLRLALNIASTRVVLLEGHNGSDAAGEVINAFGDFVVGGNYTVGIIVFIILVIINFIVITKGTTRISEVTARFTLDSMPGKQMAIDADLNAGFIDQYEAKARREEIVKEADFYGAMDGASKFVRGDAVAGLLITMINVIGGLLIGMLQHDLELAQALQNYTLLAIGDGLVAQIPSLLLSTSAAVIVLRESAQEDMGGRILKQMFGKPRTLAVTSGIMTTIGLIPGMPNLAFLSLAAVTGYIAYSTRQRQQVKKEEEQEAAQQERERIPEQRELSWDDVQPVDLIGLEVGYRLIPLVDKAQGGHLLARIKGVRKKLSQELGFLIPSVHIRDNLDLAPNLYRISLMGVSVGEAEIFPDRELAINPGEVFGKLAGKNCKDPAFGLDATWIEIGQREQAQGMGYTVVDASTVVATHLSQILQSHAHELLGHEDVQKLMDKLAITTPKLVDELVPKTLTIGKILKVLQGLLAEGIAIRDIRSIAETLAEHAPHSQDTGSLIAAVRVALGRSIVQQINGMAPELPVMTLDPSLEQILQQTVQSGSEGAGIEPGLAQRIYNSLADNVKSVEASGGPAVLLVSGLVRPLMARFVKNSVPNLHVLSFNEIPEEKQIRIIANVGGSIASA